MGDYTGVHNDVVLENLPPEVVEWFQWLCDRGQSDTTEPNVLSHPFFQLYRRSALFCCQSAYFPEMKEPPTFVQIAPAVYRLRSKASLKNYNSEVTTWLSWLAGYATSGSVRSRFEYSEEWEQQDFPMKVKK